MENQKFFKKIMVANRGEIAIRVLRAISGIAHSISSGLHF